MRKSPKPVSLLSVAVGAGTASPTVPKSPSPRPLIPQISEPVEVEEIASLSPVWDPLSNGTGSEEVEMDTLSADVRFSDLFARLRIGFCVTVRVSLYCMTDQDGDDAVDCIVICCSTVVDS